MKLEDVEVTVLDNGPGRICGKVKMKLVHRPSKYEVTGEGYSKTILKDKLLEELKQKVETWEQLLAMYDSYKANVKAKVDMDSYYFAPAPTGAIQNNTAIVSNGLGLIAHVLDGRTQAARRFIIERDFRGGIFRFGHADQLLEFGKASGEPTTTEDLVAYYFAQAREATKL